MCTILLAWQCVPGVPLLLAANRDELIARPSAPPGVLWTNPFIVGGRDLVAGGTWLAVAADGRIGAVTNRRTGSSDEISHDPARRSRGEIPIRALVDAHEVGLDSWLAQLGPGGYNPVNVLYASPRLALVAHVDDAGSPRVFELAPGPHVLTVFDLDDAARPKVAMLREALDRALSSAPDPSTLLTLLREILARHDSPTGDPRDAPCIHGDVYGTVSAATVLIGASGIEYAHAQGRPCVTPFEPVPVKAIGGG